MPLARRWARWRRAARRRAALLQRPKSPVQEKARRSTRLLDQPPLGGSHRDLRGRPAPRAACFLRRLRAPPRAARPPVDAVAAAARQQRRPPGARAARCRRASDHGRQRRTGRRAAARSGTGRLGEVQRSLKPPPASGRRTAPSGRRHGLPAGRAPRKAGPGIQDRGRHPQRLARSAAAASSAGTTAVRTDAPRPGPCPPGAPGSRGRCWRPPGRAPSGVGRGPGRVRTSSGQPPRAGQGRVAVVPVDEQPVALAPGPTRPRPGPGDASSTRPGLEAEADEQAAS